jgi:hypothetical protein
MNRTLSSARRRRESRLDFCAAVLVFQQQNGDLPIPRAFDAVRKLAGCPFDCAADPFHAYEVFASRNREQVRVRFGDFCTKQQEAAETLVIDREGIEQMHGVSVVDLRVVEAMELSDEDQRFIDDTVKTILARPKEVEQIIRAHVIKSYV